MKKSTFTVGGARRSPQTLNYDTNGSAVIGNKFSITLVDDDDGTVMANITAYDHENERRSATVSIPLAALVQLFELARRASSSNE